MNVWNRFVKPVLIGAAIGSAIGYAVTREAYAQSIIVHGLSHHSKDNSKYENVNLGLAYRTTDNVIFGALRNSYGDPIIYAGYQWQLNSYFSVTLGGAIGYEEAPVMPIAALTLSVPIYQELRLTGSVLPMEGGVVFHSGIEWRFK